MTHCTDTTRYQIMRRKLGLGLLLAASFLTLSAGVASAAEAKKQEISRTIAKEMMAAQKALQAGQWQEGLKNLDAAEQKSPLTPFDKKTIFDLKAYADIKLNHMKEAVEDYEKAMATGQYTPDEAAKTTRTLFRLTAVNQQYAKSVEFGKQVAESGLATGDDLFLMSQLYFLQKDCKDASLWADKAIAYAKKAGETPKETLYQFKLQCASDAGDNAAMDAILVDLVRLTNSTKYWNPLLKIERQDERDDHNLLMIYRIMYDTNAMDKGSDFMEMAQLLGDAGLPGEAQVVLQKGISSGMLNDQKDRATRLLNSLSARAESDKKGQAQFDAEAAKNPAGELDVKSAEVFYGLGDYAAAITAINRGLQKGQIKHLDEAYVYLGRSYAAMKNYAEAKKAFAGLKTVPNISPRVLKLWELYADKLGS